MELLEHDRRYHQIELAGSIIGRSKIEKKRREKIVKCILDLSGFLVINRKFMIKWEIYWRFFFG